MEFTIQPLLVPKYAVRVRINVQVVLAQKANIAVSFYEADQEFVVLKQELIVIEGDEYMAWGNDDNYIKELVFRKLNLPLDIIDK